MTDQPPVPESFLTDRALTRRQAIVRGAAASGALMSMSSFLAACGSSGSGSGSSSAAVHDGLYVKNYGELTPFVFSDAKGEKPHLPSRLSFTQIDTSEVHTTLASGSKQGCEDRGLDYVQANCEANVAKQVEQVQTFLQRGTGALQLITQAPETLTATSERALAAGVAVINSNEGRATVQQIANQYAIGKAQAEAAIEWIKHNLNGKATVAYLNPSALAPALVARTNGAIETFKSVPGIKVINIGLGAKEWSPQGGYTQTASLLQAHPELDALVSGDAVIKGAVKAISAAGNSNVKYVGGCDGEKEVVELVKAGNSLVKSTLGFATGPAGYASAQFAADWLEGKTIPQAMEFVAVKLNSVHAIEEFETAQNKPAEFWKQPQFLTFRGSISYENRDKWIRNTLA